MNIISLACANARVQRIYIEMYKYEQYKSTHEFTKGKLGRHKGGSGRMEPRKVGWRSTLPLRYSEQQRGKSTRSGLHDLDMRIQGSQ